MDSTDPPSQHALKQVANHDAPGNDENVHLPTSRSNQQPRTTQRSSPTNHVERQAEDHNHDGVLSLSSPRKEVKESGKEAKRKSTTPKHKNKRRKVSTRTIITVPYSEYESREGSYTIDKGDYSIVQNMLRDGIFKAEEMMLDDNEDRRVRALKTSGDERVRTMVVDQSMNDRQKLCIIYRTRYRYKSPEIHDCISSIGMLSNLQLLDLESSNIRSLPDEIGDLKDLHTLNLSSTQLLKYLPESIGDLKNLHTLNLSDTPKLESLPESIGEMTSLRNLDLGASNVSLLPDPIVNLPNLERLELACTEFLKSLPETIGNLTSLQCLDLKYSNIESLPESIGNLKSLQCLDLYFSNIGSLPESIGNLKSLCDLNITTYNSIGSLPESLGNLTSLRELSLNSHTIESLPESVWYSNLEELSSELCQSLESLPETIVNLSSLKKLYICNCKRMEKLPESLCKLSNLSELHLKKCKNIESLPHTIGNLSNLEYLVLTESDKITKLPNSIQNLSKLKVLALGENTELLPEWIGNLSNLEELNIRNCEQIKKLPESFFKLRGLRRFYFFGSGITTPPFDQQQFILTLTHRFPLLKDIRDRWQFPDYEIEIDEACKCALGRNRFRPKNPFIIAKDQPSNEVVSKLWPRVLAEASDAFGTYGDKSLVAHDYMKDEDSKYWLLKDSMASFVEVLLHRKL